MSRHWKPSGKIVRIRPVGRRSKWTTAGGYGGGGGGGRGGGGWFRSGGKLSRTTAGVVLLAAACAGAAVGIGQAQEGAAAAQAEAIEWNAVQAVPTRAPEPEDVAWEQRAGGGGDNQAPGLHRAAASNAGVRARFGFCHTGGGTNCVVDGDTFYIGGDKVRIAGIDAPETHEYRCAGELALGNRATEKLRALLNSGAVTMTAIDRDRDAYGRLLRNVAVDGEDVGEALIGAGVARDYGNGRRGWC